VALTKSTLARVKLLAKWLWAMQQRRWHDPALPSLRQVQNLIRNNPLPLQSGTRPRAYWAAFAGELNKCLSPVRPHLILGNEGLHQHFRPRCLAELLYLTIWRAATDEHSILRECRCCRGLFSVLRTNQKKKYCSRVCKNRFTVRKWRSKQAKKQRRKSQ
jgi:hypothetical protein